MFDEQKQNEPWQNDVAKQLNTLAARADYVEGDSGATDVDREFVAATRAIVARVAEFESIKPAA